MTTPPEPGFTQPVTAKKDWAQMVPDPYNPARNITRKQRIETLNGVPHWKKTVRRRHFDNFKGSCQALLIRELAKYVANFTNVQDQLVSEKFS
eukprot:scaffold1007_cov176-Amphora_coffeaeformis.AAC.26